MNPTDLACDYSISIYKKVELIANTRGTGHRHRLRHRHHIHKVCGIHIRARVDKTIANTFIMIELCYCS